MVYNVYMVHRNLKSENSQDYVQKLPQIFTFMNSASGQTTGVVGPLLLSAGQAGITLIAQVTQGEGEGVIPV